jgi:predicted phage tail protein
MAGGGFGFAGAGAMAGKFSFAAMLGNIGIGLVLTGVSEMLTPLPKRQEFNSEEDPRLSFSFGGTQQTGRAGTPVPLVYGEIFTGSVVISGGIDTEQVQA